MRPRTPEQVRQFQEDWDKRVEEGWERNGKDPLRFERGNPRTSIINTRKPGGGE